MQADELAEIVENLRMTGADCADVEVKKAKGGLPKSLRETLSAFANTSGGMIILGLDETDGFTPAGLAEPAKMAADLGAMCSEEMEPPVRPLITIHEFEGFPVLVAEVPETDPALKPCFYKGAGISKGSYIRISDGDRRLTSYEVQMLLASRGQPVEDQSPVAGTGRHDLDPVMLDAFIARLRVSRPYAFQNLDHDEILRRARVLVQDSDGNEVLSLAALLALGVFPQERFPQLMVTFVHYPTPDKAGLPSGERFLDNVSVEGPIPVIVRDALAAVRRNMSRRAIITGAGRQDVWDYPEAALREAIVNAVVHRDLSPASRGTPVQIEMYPDRLTIQNAGGLFGAVTVDKLGEPGISSARNAVLIRMLEDVPIPGETRTVCENRGSGIPTMIQALRSAGMSPPRFEDRISTFSVSFPNHTLLGEDTLAWLASLGQDGLTDSQCLFLGALRQSDEAFDNRAYRQVTGVDSRVATGELQDLAARRLIEKIGQRRWARYGLAQLHGTPERPAPAPAPAPGTRADRRIEILIALGDDVLSRAELVTRTGLSDSTVRRWLSIMRTEGTIELLSDNPRSRNAHYARSRH